MDKVLEEARAIAMREEMEKAQKPTIIGSMFMKILASGGKSWTINIHQIQAITPRKEGGTYIYFAGEEDALVAKHSYEDIISQLRLSIIR